MRIIRNSYYSYDIAIIGGGLSALVLAIDLFDSGFESVCILERETELGGNLRCSTAVLETNGGLPGFPDAPRRVRMCDYLEHLVNLACEKNIRCFLETHAHRISRNRIVLASNPSNPLIRIRAKAVVVCTGAREISRGELGIPGFRPSGVMTAGAMQKLIFKKSLDLGKRSIIIGSNNLAFEIARMTMERGDEVVLMMESGDRCAYDGGWKADSSLIRSETALRDNLPCRLLLRTDCTQILGVDHVEGVNYETRSTSGEITEGHAECDNVIISCGFLPESLLAETSGLKQCGASCGIAVDENYQTNAGGVFAVGDSIGIHDDAGELLEEVLRASKCIQKQLRERKLLALSRLRKASDAIAARLFKKDL